VQIKWAYSHGQTDTQTRVTNIHFTSSMTHAKCTERDFEVSSNAKEKRADCITIPEVIAAPKKMKKN